MTARHIAILGASNVGRALAQNLIALDDSVFFGVPEPRKYADMATQFGARIGSVEEAIADAIIVILAVPYPAALEIATQVGDWNDRILIDASNPIAPGFAGLSVGTTTDAGPLSAARYPEPFAMTWIHLAYARGQGHSWAFSRTPMRTYALVRIIGAPQLPCGNAA